MSIILDQENFYGKTSVSVVGYASPPGSQPRSQLVKESQYYSGIKMRFIWLKQCNKKKKNKQYDFGDFNFLTLKNFSFLFLKDLKEQVI